MPPVRSPLAGVTAAEGTELLTLEDTFYRDRAGSPGVTRIDCGGPPGGRVWLVDRVVVTTSGQATQPVMQLLLVAGGADPVLHDLIDTTRSALYDVAEYPTGLLVPGESTLLGAWTSGLTATGIAAVRLQVRQYRENS